MSLHWAPKKNSNVRLPRQLTGERKHSSISPLLVQDSLEKPFLLAVESTCILSASIRPEVASDERGLDHLYKQMFWMGLFHGI